MSSSNTSGNRDSGPIAKAPEYELIGKQIAHYRIDAFASQEEAGLLYRAWDLAQNQAVHLKLLASDTSQDYLQQLKLSMRLQHPNIAPTLDVAQLASGQYYQVTPSYPGETLRHKLDRERHLSPSLSLNLCRQVLDGLLAAHHRGIIHFHLKPSNIFILPDDQVKILNFGITPEPKTTLNSPHGLNYMSPEQLANKPLTQATDIWSLGIVLYECLSGQCPAPELLHDLTQDPNLIGQSPQLSQLLHDMLQRDPIQRTTRIHEIQALFNQVLALRPWYRKILHAGLKLDFNRLSLMTALVLISGFSIVYSLRQPLPTPTNLALIELAPESSPTSALVKVLDANLQRMTSNQVSTNLLTRVRLDALTPADKSHLKRHKGANLGLIISTEKERISLAIVQLESGNTLAQTGLDKTPFTALSDAHNFLLKALALDQELNLSSRIKKLTPSSPQAFAYFAKSQPDDTLPSLDRDIAQLTRATQIAPQQVFYQLALARALIDKHNLTQGPAYLERASAAVSLAHAQMPALAETHALAALIATHTGDNSNAIQHYRKAISLEPDNAWLYLQLARLYQRLNQMPEMNEALHSALVLGRFNPQLLEALADFHTQQKSLHQASSVYAKALKLAPQNIQVINKLAVLTRAQSQELSAMNLFTQAFDYQPNVTSAQNIAELYFEQADYQQAHVYFTAASRLAPDNGQIRAWRAIAQHRLEGLTQAVEAQFKQAIKDIKYQLAQGADPVSLTLAMALSLDSLGDSQQALAILSADFTARVIRAEDQVKLASVYLNSGQTELAQEWLEKALLQGFPNEKLAAYPDLVQLAHQSRLFAQS